MKCLDDKIDLYMTEYVLKYFKPQDIFWWFSLSGGKDSYTMAVCIRRWYERNSYSLYAKGLHFNQWDGAVSKQLDKKFKWLDVDIIDARQKTKESTQYIFGKQAPCRQCTDVRRNLGDLAIKQATSRRGKVNFLARGLHLSDNAVSLLWRYADGREPFLDILGLGKYQPIVELWENTFLVKPLYFVREYETQLFTSIEDFVPICCGCPACFFPSRRDIIEESMLEFISNPLWEFTIKGMTQMLNHYVGNVITQKVIQYSLSGKEEKLCHLPYNFANFVLEYYQSKLIPSLLRSINDEFDNRDLDKIGAGRLLYHKPLIGGRKLPKPSLFQSKRVINSKEALMIVALGPFWGAVGLVPEKRTHAFDLQSKIFGIEINNKFSHVISLLNKYYSRRINYGFNTKTMGNSIYNISRLCDSICGT